MASYIKIIISSVILLLLISFVLSSPVPGGSKSHKRVRIHVPVKHHTHVITKTQVKTVHIPVLVKEKPKKQGWDNQWAYSKKKTRVTLPDDDDE